MSNLLATMILTNSKVKEDLLRGGQTLLGVWDREDQGGQEAVENLTVVEDQSQVVEVATQLRV